MDWEGEKPKYGPTWRWNPFFRGSCSWVFSHLETRGRLTKPKRPAGTMDIWVTGERAARRQSLQWRTKQKCKLPLIAPTDKSQPHYFQHSMGCFEPGNSCVYPTLERQEGRSVRKHPCTYSTIVLPAVMSTPVSLNHQDWISHFQEIGPAKAFQSFASVIWPQVIIISWASFLGELNLSVQVE